MSGVRLLVSQSQEDGDGSKRKSSQMRRDGYTPISGVDDRPSTTDDRSCNQQMVRVDDVKGIMRSVKAHHGHPCGCRIINPQQSVCLEIWDILVGSALVVTAFVMPFEVAFMDSNLLGFVVFNRAMDLFFISDMGLQFFTMCPDPSHPSRWVKDWKDIAIIYMSGWFWIDLISILPFDLIFVALGKEERSPSSFKIARLFRLVRLIRLARFGRLMQRWHTSFGYSFAIIEISKFFCGTVACCHWMACIWGGIGLQRYRIDSEAATWITAVKNGKILEDHEKYNDPLFIYSMSLYWSVMTLTGIGYGDICPQSWIEYCCATVCMGMMAAVWAYVIGAVCGIVATLEPHTVQFKRTMDDLNALMEQRHLPTTMKIGLRTYFHEAKHMRRRAEERHIINQMSPMLQGEVAVMMHQPWLQKVWYLANLDAEVVVELARQLEGMVFAPSEAMPYPFTLFILQRGICAHKGRIMKAGDTWGDDMILDDDSLMEQVWARSFSYVEVLLLSRAGLDRVLDSFPNTLPHIRRAQVRLTAMRGIIKISRLVAELLSKANVSWKDLSEEEKLDLIRKAAHTQWPDMRDKATERHMRDKGSKNPSNEAHPVVEVPQVIQTNVDSDAKELKAPPSTASPSDAKELKAPPSTASPHHQEIAQRRASLGLEDISRQPSELPAQIAQQLEQLLARVDHLTDKVDEMSRAHKQDAARERLRGSTMSMGGHA